MKVYEFSDHDDFMASALFLKKEGQLLEAYSFLPEDKLAEDLNLDTPWVNRGAILGGIFGAVGGFLLQYMPNVWGYSMNISGKPLNSWPAFMLITFELGVLTCAFAIVGSFFLSNKYPRFDRIIFDVESYNKNRHHHYFILSKEEVSHVKALACHDLTTPLD
jgi:hypothetical protein